MRYGSCQLLDIKLPATSATYTDGALVGGLINLGPLKSIVASGVLKSLIVTDFSGNGAALTVLIFSDLPTGTFTNNATLTLTRADLLKVVAKIDVATTDYVTAGGVKIAQVDLALVLKSVQAARNLYMAVIVAGSQTYTANDLQFRLGILGD